MSSSDSSTGDMKKLTELLVKISDEGNEENLKTLKHLAAGLDDPIPRRLLEGYTTMLDVFQYMLQMELVSRERLDSFKELMKLVFRNSPSKFTVEKYISEYEYGEDSLTPSMGNSTVSFERLTLSKADVTSTTSDFSALPSNIMGSTSIDTTSQTPNTSLPTRFADAFNYAAKVIGLDWKIFARLAEMQQSAVLSIQNSYPKDIERQAYETFKFWYAQQHRPSMTIFRKTLRSIPRNDIADDLKVKDDKQAQQM